MAIPPTGIGIVGILSLIILVIWTNVKIYKGAKEELNPLEGR